MLLESDITSDILEEAAEHVDRGWVQRSYCTGGVCLVGAVDLALRNHGICVYYAAIGDILRDLLEIPVICDTRVDAHGGQVRYFLHSPEAWNDAEGRTKEEVKDKLLFGAKKLRNEGR